MSTVARQHTGSFMSLPEPKLTRAQRRYRTWLASGASDCGVTFGEWLRGREYDRG